MKGQGPASFFSADILHLHGGGVGTFSRVMLPGEVEAESLVFIRMALPSAKWVTVGQGQAFLGAQHDDSCPVWELLTGSVPRLAGGTGWNPTPRRAAFAKAPNPGQAGKGSVEEQPWEDFQGSISLFFMGSSAWLALSGGVTGLLKA